MPLQSFARIGNHLAGAVATRGTGLPATREQSPAAYGTCPVAPPQVVQVREAVPFSRRNHRQVPHSDRVVPRMGHRGAGAPRFFQVELRVYRRSLPRCALDRRRGPAAPTKRLSRNTSPKISEKFAAAKSQDTGADLSYPG